jgi:hypothetical protein
MEQNLPLLADVIFKVKQLQELTPEEELVYLMNIEKFSEDQARAIIEDNDADGP